MSTYSIGEKYGRNDAILLEVLQREPNSNTKGRFRCRCGKEFITQIYAVKCGNIIGCGCSKGAEVVHGLAHHKLYGIYSDIRKRCYIRTNKSYKNYGARGIGVSEEFLSNVKTFIDYIESLPNYENREKDRLELDRIDNDGDYEKDNLRWATKKEQANNRRKTHAEITIVDDV
jgi:hypothetical protein